MHYKKDSLDHSNEGIRLISVCPLCNTAYNPLSSKILEEKEDAQLIHLECDRCYGAIVALISQGGVGLSSVGLVTDLSSEDVIKFKSSPDVTYNDVIDIHEVLEQEERFLAELENSVNFGF